jgi:hypothetical protein
MAFWMGIQGVAGSGRRRLIGCESSPIPGTGKASGVDFLSRRRKLLLDCRNSHFSLNLFSVSHSQSSSRRRFAKGNMASRLQSAGVTAMDSPLIYPVNGRPDQRIVGSRIGCPETGDDVALIPDKILLAKQPLVRNLLPTGGTY